MKSLPVRIVLVLITAVALGQRVPEPRLRSAGLPQYPAIARQAQIQGEVKVEFVLNSDGEPTSVVAVSGHPMLKAAAEQNVKTWRFELPKDLYRTEWKYDTIFNFKISNDKQPYEDPKLTVTLDSYRYVEVTTNPPSTKYAHDCPLPTETQPPQSVTAGDFVELSRSGCYGTCPSYKVKVSENGDVSWSGGGFVETVGERHSTIASEAAHALLEKFRSPAFWALCGGYTASVTDNPTMRIEVRIGGRSKTVWNYADSAPGFEASLEDAVDAAANTHKSPNGDTPLMASAISRLFDEDLAHAGADVNAKNSAGTTALMILAAAGEADEVRDALKAGANATLKDAMGRTALDYLRLANCGKSPVPRYSTFTTGEKCDQLGEDDVREVAVLLKTAKPNPRR